MQTSTILAGNDFFSISNKLQQEVLAYKKTAGIKEWKIHQVAFLKSHHYFTRTAQQKRNPVKLQHLKKLLDEQKGIPL